MKLSLGKLLIAMVLTPSIVLANGGGSQNESSDSAQILFTVQDLVRVSGFTDINLGSWGGSGSRQGNDNICIGKNAPDNNSYGAYKVVATGSGNGQDAQAFGLSNGVNYINYLAYFNDEAGTAGRSQVYSGMPLGSQSGRNRIMARNFSHGCVEENANLSIVVPESELGTAAGGYYSGTLTLTVMPE